MNRCLKSRWGTVFRLAEFIKAVPSPPERYTLRTVSGRSSAGAVSFERLIRQRSDRLPQPLHRELDVCRLQMAPAFDLGLIFFGYRSKYSLANVRSWVNFSRMKGSFGIARS